MMRLDAEETLVLRWAVMSRLSVWLVGVLSHMLIKPYDRSAALPSSFASADISATAHASAIAAEPLLDGAVNSLIAPFANWDGVYFVRIAEAGYTFEQFHAFFPLLPLSMRGLSGTVSSLTSPLFAALGLPPLLSVRSALLVAGFCITNACFVLAAWTLLWLGRHMLRHDVRCDGAKGNTKGNDSNSVGGTGATAHPPPHPRALLAALLFCIAPSGVFFSALYTEAPFAVLSFGGMLALARARAAYAHRCSGQGQVLQGDAGRGASSAYGRWRLCAAGCFALAATARSNGVLLLLLLAYDSAAQSPAWCDGHRRDWLGHWLRTAALGVAGALPWCCVHFYGWARYCRSDAAAATGADTDRAPPRPWCDTRGLGGLLPPQLSLYGFVQREYWNVGAFRYYEVKQVPNFLLAAPMAVLSAGGIVAAARMLRDRVVLRARSRAQAQAQTEAKMLRDACGGGAGSGIDVPLAIPNLIRVALQEPMLALTIQWAALLALGVIVVHVQVLTRFLSACPQVYWHAAALVARDDGAMGGKRVADCALDVGRGGHIWTWWQRVRLRTVRTAAPSLVLGYFVLYGHVLGPILFCNFYPWT